MQSHEGPAVLGVVQDGQSLLRARQSYIELTLAICFGKDCDPYAQ